MIGGIQLTYCQYPITKKIKGDSVVIMRISQADTINLLYKSYNDTIKNLKNSITQKKLEYDSIIKETSIAKDSLFDWKWKYKANRDTYYAREKDIWKKEKLHEASKLILVAIIILQMSTISNLHK